MRKDKRWKNSFLCPIEVTNTDPKLIKIFVDYLRKDLGLAKESFKAQLQIHEGDNKDALEKFWSEVSGIPLAQFNRTIVRKIGNKIGKTKGTFKVRIYNKTKFDQMKSLLDNELAMILTGD